MTTSTESALIDTHLTQLLTPHFNTELLTPALRDRVRLDVDGDSVNFEYYSASGERIYTPERFIDEVLQDDRWKAAKITHQSAPVAISDPNQPYPTGAAGKSAYGAGYFGQRTASAKLDQTTSRIDRARALISGK
ncbi:hypothetical protein DUG50_22780 [Salmonella enterica subsp. enterica serovar Miami]|nr:hypothetical protein [Salmonella enterica subsp. enterica serovar Miami]